jgi:hypothetical protein
MIKLGDVMSSNTDINQMWPMAKFIIVHMIQPELYLVLLIAAICSWHLANLLAKHNDRLRDVIFTRRISYACLLVIAILFMLRQFLK